jgi:hypothetical protein
LNRRGVHPWISLVMIAAGLTSTIFGACRDVHRRIALIVATISKVTQNTG